MPTQLSSGERARIATTEGRATTLKNISASTPQALGDSSDAAAIVRAHIQDLSVELAGAISTKAEQRRIDELRTELRTQQAALASLDAASEPNIRSADRSQQRPFGSSAGEIVLGRAAVSRIIRG